MLHAVVLAVLMASVIVLRLLYHDAINSRNLGHVMTSPAFLMGLGHVVLTAGSLFEMWLERRYSKRNESERQLDYSGMFGVLFDTILAVSPFAESADDHSRKMNNFSSYRRNLRARVYSHVEARRPVKPPHEEEVTMSNHMDKGDTKNTIQSEEIFDHWVVEQDERFVFHLQNCYKCGDYWRNTESFDVMDDPFDHVFPAPLKVVKQLMLHRYWRCKSRDVFDRFYDKFNDSKPAPPAPPAPRPDFKSNQMEPNVAPEVKESKYPGILGGEGLNVDADAPLAQLRQEINRVHEGHDRKVAYALTQAEANPKTNEQVVEEFRNYALDDKKRVRQQRKVFWQKVKNSLASPFVWFWSWMCVLFPKAKRFLSVACREIYVVVWGTWCRRAFTIGTVLAFIILAGMRWARGREKSEMKLEARNKTGIPHWLKKRAKRAAKRGVFYNYTSGADSIEDLQDVAEVDGHSYEFASEEMDEAVLWSTIRRGADIYDPANMEYNVRVPIRTRRADGPRFMNVTVDMEGARAFYDRMREVGEQVRNEDPSGRFNNNIDAAWNRWKEENWDRTQGRFSRKGKPKGEKQKPDDWGIGQKMDAECIHAADCPKKMMPQLGLGECNVNCGGRNCYHWMGRVCPDGTVKGKCSPPVKEKPKVESNTSTEMKDCAYGLKCKRINSAEHKKKYNHKAKTCFNCGGDHQKKDCSKATAQEPKIKPVPVTGPVKRSKGIAKKIAKLSGQEKTEALTAAGYTTVDSVVDKLAARKRKSLEAKEPIMSAHSFGHCECGQTGVHAGIGEFPKNQAIVGASPITRVTVAKSILYIAGTKPSEEAKNAATGLGIGGWSTGVGNGFAIEDWVVTNYHVLLGTSSVVYFTMDDLNTPKHFAKHPLANHVTGAFVDKKRDVAFFPKPGAIPSLPWKECDLKGGDVVTLYALSSLMNRGVNPDLCYSQGRFDKLEGAVSWPTEDGAEEPIQVGLAGYHVSSLPGWSGGVVMHNGKVIGLHKGSVDVASSDRCAWFCTLTKEMLKSLKNGSTPGSQASPRGSGDRTSSAKQ